MRIKHQEQDGHIGLRTGDASNTLGEALHTFSESLGRLACPAACLALPKADAVVTQVLGICKERLCAFDGPLTLPGPAFQLKLDSLMRGE